MAKKSNKTSHVLNLLTNRTGLTASELEQSTAVATEEYASAEAGTAGEHIYTESATTTPSVIPAATVSEVGVITPEIPVGVTGEMPASVTISNPASITIENLGEPPANIHRKAQQEIQPQNIPYEAPPVQHERPSPVPPADTPRETPPQRETPPAGGTGDIIANRIRANLEKLEAHEAEARAEEMRLRPAENAEAEGGFFAAAKEDLEMTIEKSIDNVQPIPLPEKPSNARVEAFAPEKFDSGAGASDDGAGQTPEFAAPNEVSAPQSKPVPPLQMNNGDPLVIVNILEEIVHTEAMRMMAELGMCCCEKCQMDVKALALNNITPKYVVSRKGALFAQISTHINQNKADILAQITKACILVQKSPGHS